jgi:DNA polymerase sigma
VHLFGSTATRLNLRSSNDLDISLDLPSVVDKVGTSVAVLGSYHTYIDAAVVSTSCMVCWVGCGRPVALS